MVIQADDFYSVLSHPVRLRAALLLYSQGELCVCELIHVLELQQPVVSRHLSQLKAAGLLVSRKQGQWVYYRIHQDLALWMQQALALTHDGVSQQVPYKDDIKKLKTMNDRPSKACC